VSFDELITNRTQADVVAGNARGSYGAADLNRVGEAANAVREMLAEYGYAVPEELRTDWTVRDIPRQSDMERYIRVLAALRDSLRFSESVLPLPGTMERLTFISANQIESMLSQLGPAVESIPLTWFDSGQIEAGVAYA
jgi:hypothetical protein